MDFAFLKKRLQLCERTARSHCAGLIGVVENHVVQTAYIDDDAVACRIARERASAGANAKRRAAPQQRLERQPHVIFDHAINDGRWIRIETWIEELPRHL